MKRPLSFSFTIISYWYLVDTLLMATTFKLGGEVLVHNLASHLLIDEATRHHQHVSIVVLTNQVSNLRNPAQSGADALMLVQRHVDALAAATDGNAGEHLASLDAASQCVTEVRVVARVLGISSVVLILEALLLEILLYELFKSIASVIAGYAYCLYFHNYKLCIKPRASLPARKRSGR